MGLLGLGIPAANSNSGKSGLSEHQPSVQTAYPHSVPRCPVAQCHPCHFSDMDLRSPREKLKFLIEFFRTLKKNYFRITGCKI